MHWPVPRGGDAELVTWPTVAWLLRVGLSHKSERCPFGADILRPAPPAGSPTHLGHH